VASLYLEDDDGDDGHLGAEPREESLQLTALTNQVAVHHDGDQAHGLHRRLREEGEFKVRVFFMTAKSKITILTVIVCSSLERVNILY